VRLRREGGRERKERPVWTARPTAGELAVVVLARVQVAIEVSGDGLQVHEVAEPSSCAFPITRKYIHDCQTEQSMAHFARQ
jgi:hypothetical protein